MPYIKSRDRGVVEPILEQLLRLRYADAGTLNYIISSLLWKALESDKSYARANELIGMLECVKQEFYRRKVAPYEDLKIVENGDIE